MTDSHTRIFITGATGFVGRQVVDALGDHRLRVLTHRATLDIQTEPRVEIVQGDVTNPADLSDSMEGCSSVIHLVAAIQESRDNSFDRLIRQGTENVVAEATRAGVERIILMSANGARDDPRYPYLSAKWHAEQAVIESGISYSIFRPSVIFGPGDEFINKLASVVRMFPIIPVIGDGTSRFQPVHVHDVADAFRRVIDKPTVTANATLELGGARAYTYRELVDAIRRELQVTKPTLNVPVGLMKLAVRASTPLPSRLRPPVTLEQLRMLALDNVTPNNAMEALLGRKPNALEGNLSYLAQ